MMRLRASIFVLLLAAAGCGDDSSPTTSDEPSTAADAGSRASADASQDPVSNDAQESSDSPYEWVFNQRCEPSQQSDTCERCKEEKCCETFKRVREPDGRSVSRCVIDCTEQKVPFTECWVRCDAQFPAGTEPFATYNSCVEQFCSAAEYGCGKPPSSCESCLHDRCGREWLELMSSRDGHLWALCNADCTPLDMVCYTKCYELYPKAMPSLERMAQCQASQCPVCGTMML